MNFIFRDEDQLKQQNSRSMQYDDHAQLANCSNFCLLVSSLFDSSTLKMEMIYSPETSGSTELHGFITQRTILSAVPNVRTSNSK
jgi:hypothetical protein